MVAGGTTAWNARRQPGGALHSAIPDFSDANLRSEFENAGLVKPGERMPLARYVLTSADLTSADLTRAVLTRAVLTRAVLTDADLTDADLTGTKLNRAKLIRARIFDTDLADAQFENADLTRAELVRVQCNKTTNFVGANFTGTNLTGTQLWNAKIYSISKSPDQIHITRRRVTSVSSLLTAIKNIQDIHDDSGYRLFFRGEHQTGWELQPSVMRDSVLRSHESRMLIDLAAQRPEEFNGLISGLAHLVTAQHHGLKTRFLDVSSNPLVALFHACIEEKMPKRPKNARLHIFVTPRDIVKSFTSDTISVIANYARLPTALQKAFIGENAGSGDYNTYNVAMDRLHQLIQSEKPYFVSRIDPRDFYRVVIVEPQQTSERIRAQSGAFLVSALHKRFEREQIAQKNADIPVYAHHQLTIPGNRRVGILEELRMLKVTHETLFPGLDASAKAITEAYHRQSDVL